MTRPVYTTTPEETDIVTGYANEEHNNTFKETNTYANFAAAGDVDPNITYETDAPLISADEPVNLEDIYLNDIEYKKGVDIGSQYGYVFNHQAQIVYDWVHKRGKYQRNADFLERAEQVGNLASASGDPSEPLPHQGISRQAYDLFVDQIASQKEQKRLEEADKVQGEDISRFGLEWAAQLAYSDIGMLRGYLNVDDLPQEVALAQATLLDRYSELGDFTGRGTVRFLKNMLASPSTYFGLGSVGAVKNLLAQGGAKGLRQSMGKRLMRTALGASVIGAEGSAYTAGADYIAQILEQGGSDKPVEIDWTRIGAAAGLGFFGGSVLTAGMPPVVRSVSKLVGDVRRGKAPVGLSIEDRTPGGMANVLAGKVSERGVENLRLHKKRLKNLQEKNEAYPGTPKNERLIIKAPQNSDLPDFAVGKITPDDWIARTEKLLSSEEIKKGANWYDELIEKFTKETGGDKEQGLRLMGAWMAAQQNESPANAMANVIYMQEQLNRGIAVDQIKGKGLPAANKAAITILRGEALKGGAGQKISDFLDSGLKQNVRRIMGNEEEGGKPFTVDIHTARDTGLVDQVLLNHLQRLGYDVPSNVTVDVGGGGIKGPMYENRAIFGRELTDHVNSINWQGRNDWEPREVQAIGWNALTKMYGGGGTLEESLQLQTRRIAMEVDPGESSPWAQQFGERYNNLADEKRYEINEKITSKAVEIVNERQGINLTSIVHGTGGWERFTNPSAVQQGLMSRETAKVAAAELGLLLNQTEVWVNSAKPLTKNPKNYSIDLVEPQTKNLRDNNKLLELWEKIVEADPDELIRGYQPITVSGATGIRIIIDKDILKAWAKRNKTNMAAGGKKVESFYKETLDDIIENLDYDLRAYLSESNLDKLRNDWKGSPDGENYRADIRQASKSAAPGGRRPDINNNRTELTNLFDQLIAEAEGTGKKQPKPEAENIGLLGKKKQELIPLLEKTRRQNPKLIVKDLIKQGLWKASDREEAVQFLETRRAVQEQRRESKMLIDKKSQEADSWEEQMRLSRRRPGDVKDNKYRINMYRAKKLGKNVRGRELWNKTNTEIVDSNNDLDLKKMAIRTANLEAVPRQLKKQGWKKRHSSINQAQRRSSHYLVSPDGNFEVRLSDHDLPPTPERINRGTLPRWDEEIVLTGKEGPSDVIDEILDMYKQFIDEAD